MMGGSALPETLLIIPNQERAVNMLEDRAAIQGPDKNLMKLNKGKVLDL